MAFNILSTDSVQLEGELETLPGDTTVSFQYRKEGNSTWNETSGQVLSSPGTFTASVSGLDEGAVYQYRTKAVGPSSNEYFGLIKSFELDFDVLVRTDLATGFGFGTEEYPVSAVFQGAIESAENVSSGEFLFQYRKVGNTAWQEAGRQPASSPQEFSAEVTGLDSSSRYEYRARIEPSSGDPVNGRTVPVSTSVLESFEDGFSRWTVNDTALQQDATSYDNQAETQFTDKTVPNGELAAKFNGTPSETRVAEWTFPVEKPEIVQWHFYNRPTNSERDGQAVHLLDEEGNLELAIGTYESNEEGNADLRVWDGDGDFIQLQSNVGQRNWIFVQVRPDFENGTYDYDVSYSFGSNITSGTRSLNESKRFDRLAIGQVPGEKHAIDASWDRIQLRTPTDLEANTKPQFVKSTTEADVSGALSRLEASEATVKFQVENVTSGNRFETSVQTLTETGDFTETLTGLSEGDQYRYRAVASTSSSTVVGNYQTFETVSPTTEALTAHWDFNRFNVENGDLIDQTGNGYDAQINSITDQSVDGKTGDAFEFNSSFNDNLAIRNLEYDQAGQIDELAISTWIRNRNGTNQAILSFDPQHVFELKVNSFLTEDENNGGNATPIPSLKSGWNQITARYSKSENVKEVYINGNLANRVSNPHDGLSLKDAVNDRFGFIGERSGASSFNGNTNGNNLNADLSDLKLHDTSSLSGSRAQIRYTRESTGLDVDSPNFVGSYTGIELVATVDRLPFGEADVKFVYENLNDGTVTETSFQTVSSADEKITETVSVQSGDPYKYKAVLNQSASQTVESKSVEFSAPDQVPTFLNADVDTENSEIRLDWGAAIPEAVQGFNVYRKSSDETTFTQVATGLTSSEYVDTITDGNFSQTYEVTIVNSSGVEGPRDISVNTDSPSSGTVPYNIGEITAEPVDNQTFKFETDLEATGGASQPGSVTVRFRYRRDLGTPEFQTAFAESFLSSDFDRTVSTEVAGLSSSKEYELEAVVEGFNDRKTKTGPNFQVPSAITTVNSFKPSSSEASLIANVERVFDYSKVDVRFEYDELDPRNDPSVPDWTGETGEQAVSGDDTRLSQFVEGLETETFEITNPLNVSNFSYDGLSKDTGSEDSNTASVALSDDGTNLFIAGLGTNSVYQYDLSTSFDMSTASYNGVSFDVSSEVGGNAWGVSFNDSGTKMYVVDGSGFIYEYNLATGFDLSTASYSGNFLDISSELNNPLSAAVFNSDGTKLYVSDYDSAAVYTYDLTAGFDLSTATYNGVSFDTSGEANQPIGTGFNSDYTKMFVISNNIGVIYQYDLGTAEDITTATYNGVSFDASSQVESTSRDLTFGSEKKKAYVVDGDSNNVFQYDTGVSFATKSVQTSGLTAFWTFDDEDLNGGTVTDITGNGFDGETRGGVTTSVSTPSSFDIGQAFSFDGNDDYVPTRYILQNSESLSKMTVSAWVKVPSNGGDWSILDMDQSEVFGFYVNNSSNNLEFPTITNSGNHTIQGTQNLRDNNWHHVVGVYDSTLSSNDKKLYVDGQLEVETTSNHVGANLGENHLNRYAIIGDGSEAYSFDGNQNNVHMEGDISNIRLYDNKALTETEIFKIYDFGIGNGTAVDETFYVFRSKYEAPNGSFQFGEVQGVSDAVSVEREEPKFDSNSITLDFENGFDSEWTVFDSAIRPVSDRAFSGSQSVSTDGNNHSRDIFAERPVPSGTDEISFYWQETSSQTGAGFRVLNSNGDIEVAFMTDNPQWDLYDAAGDNNITTPSTSYNTWTLVRFTFDFANGTYDYEISNEEDGGNTTLTGTRNLRHSVDAAKIALGNASFAGRRTADSMWWDLIKASEGDSPTLLNPDTVGDIKDINRSGSKPAVEDKVFKFADQNDFEDGIGPEWTVNNNAFQIDTTRVFSGSQSVAFDSGLSSNPIVAKRAIPENTGKISWYFQAENNNSVYAHVLNSNGNFETSIGIEDQDLDVFDGSSGAGRQQLNGFYPDDRWHFIEIELDFQNGEYTIRGDQNANGFFNVETTRNLENGVDAATFALGSSPNVERVDGWWDLITFVEKAVDGKVVVDSTGAENVTATGAKLNADLRQGTDFSDANIRFDYREVGSGVWNTLDAGTKSSTGTFSATIPEGTLQENRNYEFRAAGTFGERNISAADVDAIETLAVDDVSTGGATSITASSATFNGTVADLASGSTADLSFKYREVGASTFNTLDAGTTSSEGNFSETLPEGTLTENVQHEYKAVATADGTTKEGSLVTFTTADEQVAVTTGSASGVDAVSATLNGTLDTLENTSDVDLAFDYGPSGNVTANRTTSQTVSSTGSFNQTVTGLDQAVDYEFRIVAIGQTETAGNNAIFTTDALEVSTTGSSSIDAGTATVEGNVDALNDTNPPADVSFNFGISSPDTNQSAGTAGEGQTFSTDLTGLQPGETYQFQAKGLDSGATGETDVGQNLTFTTLNVDLSVSSISVTGTTSLDVTGSLDVNETPDAVDLSVEYKPQSDSNYTSQSAGTQTATGTFTESITGLTAGVTYDVRVVGQVDTATVRSASQQGKTRDVAVSTTASSSVGAGTATLEGSLDDLASDEDATVSFEYGLPGSLNNETSGQTLSSTGTFSTSVSGFEEGTQQEFRAKAVTTGSGEVETGAIQSFTTLDVVVSATGAVATGPTSADVTGSLDVNETSSAVDLTVEHRKEGETTWSSSTDAGSQTATGSFTQEITGLSTGVSYEFRVVGQVDTAQTVSGIVSAETEEVLVSTVQSSSVSISGATLEGSLDELEGSETDATVKFEYGTAGNVSANEVIASESPLASSGPFSAAISGLSEDTQYEFRAVATGNPSGDVNRGSTLSFTTVDLDNVTNSVAANGTTELSLEGEVTTYGGSQSVDVFFEYRKTGASTFQTVDAGTVSSPSVYTATATGLEVGKEYEARAVATVESVRVEGALQTVELEDVSFSGAPTVSNVGTSSATVEAEVTELESGVTTDVSIEFSEQGGTDSGSAVAATISSPSVVSANLTGLTVGSTYDVTAKTTIGGTVYETAVTSFTLESLDVSTVSAQNVGAETVTLNGSLDALEPGESADVSFEYGDVSVTDNQTSLQTLSSTGSFSENVTALQPDSQYEFRAKGNVSGETDTGVTETFTTQPISVSTAEVTGGTESSVTLEGTVDVLASSQTDADLQFQYGKTSGSVTDNSTTLRTGFVEADTISETISGLDSGTEYQFRLVATANPSGKTVVSGTKIFETPKVTTGSATTRVGSATVEGTATNIGQYSSLQGEFGIQQKDSGFTLDNQDIETNEDSISSDSTAFSGTTDEKNGDVLQPNTRYIYQARLEKNQNEKATGAVKEFTTENVEVSTYEAPVSRTATSLTLRAGLDTYTGSETVTVGIELVPASTDFSNPTVKSATRSSTGTEDFTFTGLSEGQSYKYKAFAEVDGVRVEGSAFEDSTNESITAFWTLDDANVSSGFATDTTGNGNDAELHGMIQTGKSTGTLNIGEAFGFDGIDDYLSLELAINSGRSKISTVFWIKTSGDPSNIYRVISFDDDEIFSVSVENGNAVFETKGSNGSTDNLSSNTSVADGTWHQVAVVYDKNTSGDDKKIYVDGSLDASVASLHSGNEIGDGSTRYGFIADGSEASSYDGNTTGEFYEGDISNVRFYKNKALTASEIQTFYNDATA